MPNPQTVTLISPHPGGIPELPDRLFSYDLVAYGPEQIDTLPDSSRVILLHLNGNLAEGPKLIGLLKKQLPRTPIVVLGENPSVQQVIEAYESGADEYLLLPLDMTIVRRKLLRHLQRLHGPLGWWHRFWIWLGRRLRPAAASRLSLTHTGLIPATIPARATDLNVRFFGPFEVRIRDREYLRLRSRRVQQLLACLLYFHAPGVTPDRLMDYLWPEVPYESARNSLNVALSQLRGLLTKHFALKEPILLTRGKYTLSPELTLRTDLDQFNQYRSQGRQFGKLNDPDREAECYRLALDFYRGDFLEELTNLEWTAHIRDTLWETRLHLLERLSQYYFDGRVYDQAIRIAKQLLGQDACLEKVHRQLMLSYYHKGDRGRALQQFAKCRKALREELNAEPSALTREVYDKIRGI